MLCYCIKANQHNACSTHHMMGYSLLLKSWFAHVGGQTCKLLDGFSQTIFSVAEYDKLCFYWIHCTHASILAAWKSNTF